MQFLGHALLPSEEQAQFLGKFSPSANHAICLRMVLKIDSLAFKIFEDLLPRLYRMVMEITKDTTLVEILKNSEAEKILAKHNLPCLSCPFAQYEIKSLKLDEVCKMYNIDAAKILKELNGVYKK